MPENLNDILSRIQPIPAALLNLMPREETEPSYWDDKAIDPPKQRRDFQTTRINQNHEKAMGAEPISHKQYGSGRTVEPKFKEFADSFPHQCRYFTGECTFIVERPAENRSHFDMCHPTTSAEYNLYMLAHTREPGGKTAYLLSLCFGRSEETIRKMIPGYITKWGRRDKEIEQVHRTFKQNLSMWSVHYKKLAEGVEVEEPINLALPENLIPQNMAGIQQEFNLTQILETTQETSITDMQQNVNVFVEQYNELSKKLEAAENREKELQHVVDVLRKCIDSNDSLVRDFFQQYTSRDLFDDLE